MKDALRPIGDCDTVSLSRFRSGGDEGLPAPDRVGEDVFELFVPDVAVTVTVAPPFPLDPAFFVDPVDYRASRALRDEPRSAEESARYWAAMSAPCAVVVDDARAGTTEWISRMFLVDPPDASGRAPHLAVWISQDDWAKVSIALREITDGWPGWRSPAVLPRDLPPSFQAFFRSRLCPALREYQRRVHPQLFERA